MSREEDLRRALAEFEAEATQHHVKAQALWQIASGMRTLSGLRPQGVEAIRLVMREGGVWTPRTMCEELKRRDWELRSADPLRATGAAMSRMYRQRQGIERVGRGLYRYVGPWAAPTP